MCLAGGRNDGGVNVTTVKDESWWQEAIGSKALAMAEEVTQMCGDDAILRDVAALQPFAASVAADYVTPYGDTDVLPDGGSNVQCYRSSLGGCYRAPLPTQPCVRGTTH